jgi:hypothetical protein
MIRPPAPRLRGRPDPQHDPNIIGKTAHIIGNIIGNMIGNKA